MSNGAHERLSRYLDQLEDERDEALAAQGCCCGEDVHPVVTVDQLALGEGLTA